MATERVIKQTLGRFLDQPNKSFPAYCETMAELQNLVAVVSTMGNAVGDKTILLGCELTSGGAYRNPGYVFLRTVDFPDGEVVYWAGGNVSGGMYLAKEAKNSQGDGVTYEQAYVTRYLAPGVGTENYDWADFIQPPTLAEMQTLVEELRAEIEAITPSPLGIVQVWAGAAIPSGYALCDGRELSQTDYPALFAAIGTAFNTAVSSSGTNYTTRTGYFRLPDLRGRFIVGQKADDLDYATLGKAGGEKVHQLTEEEIPAHVHEVKDYFFAEADDDATIAHDDLGRATIGSADSDRDNRYLYYERHDTETAGGGMSHENRPPYYTLAYIMRLA